MVSALDSEWSYLGSSLAGALRCVLEQDTLLYKCLSPPWCLIGAGEFTAGGDPVMD